MDTLTIQARSRDAQAARARLEAQLRSSGFANKPERARPARSGPDGAALMRSEQSVTALDERDTVEALRSLKSGGVLRAGPEITRGLMAAQPLDLGPVARLADRLWRALDQSPALRRAVTVTLIATLLGTIYYIVRV